MLSAAVAALLCGVALADCGGTSHHASAAKARPKFSHARFIPANFVSQIVTLNEYLPLRPGLQSVRKGTTQIGHRAVPHIVVSTVTEVIRRIDGVRAVAVIDQDIEAGQVTQQSFEWRAQDLGG